MIRILGIIGLGLLFGQPGFAYDTQGGSHPSGATNAGVNVAGAFAPGPISPPPPPTSSRVSGPARPGGSSGRGSGNREVTSGEGGGSSESGDSSASDSDGDF